MDTLQMEQRLWDYIDGVSAVSEKTVVENLIRENQQWRELYRQLMQLHQSLTESELEQPSMRFTKNVMEEIAKYQIAPAAKKYINQKIIRGIAAFFAFSIIGFLIYGFAQVDWSAFGSSESSFGIALPKMAYGKFFNNTMMNVFLMLNTVLGLLFLDRYLSRKRSLLSPGGGT